MEDLTKSLVCVHPTRWTDNGFVFGGEGATGNLSRQVTVRDRVVYVNGYTNVLFGFVNSDMEYSERDCLL
jgi:hypothetical protein